MFNNSLNCDVTGILITDSSGNFTGQTVTDHNLLIGGSSNSITSLPPSSTPGKPLISQGAGVNPSFGVATVPGGGTGASTLTGIMIGNGTAAVTANTVTNRNVLIGGTSNSITSVAPSSTSGVPLISQGASSNPAFGTAVVAGGGTGAVTLTGVLTGNGTSAFTANAVTQYKVLIGGASNAVSEISSLGTAKQVLTSAGAGANPAFGNAALTLIETKTASASAELIFTSGITTYTTYLFVWDNVIASGAGNFLDMQVSVDGGSSYIDANYISNVWFMQNASITLANSSASTAVATYHISDTTGNGGYLWCNQIGTSSKPTFNGQGYETAGNYLCHISSVNTTTTGVNAFKWFMSAGTITSGTISLYAVSKT